MLVYFRLYPTRSGNPVRRVCGVSRFCAKDFACWVTRMNRVTTIGCVE